MWLLRRIQRSASHAAPPAEGIHATTPHLPAPWQDILEKCEPRRPTGRGYSCNNAVPTRFLHDCRRTAARNLIRASVPERVAMLLTGHKTRAIFDRYNIINEQELLEAGDQLVAYLAQHAQTTPRGRAHPTGAAVTRTAPPLRLVRRTTA